MRAETLKGHLDGMLLACSRRSRATATRSWKRCARAAAVSSTCPPGRSIRRSTAWSRGLIEASWSVHGGRRRRLYQLTPDGRRALTAERRTWRDFSAAVTALLQSPAPATSPS